jgi:hypothetical protein
MKALVLFGAFILAGLQASAGYPGWTGNSCAEFSYENGSFIQYISSYYCRYPSEWPGYRHPHHHQTTVVVQQVTVEYNANLAVELADRTLAVVQVLKRYESHAQIGAVLNPIRKHAAYLKAAGNSNSPYSGAVRQELINLSAQLLQAKTYIEEKLEADNLVDTVIELMSVKAKIDSITR